MARPHVIYQAKPGSALEVNRELYARLGPDGGNRKLVDRFVIPRRSGRAWPVRAGQIFRIVAVEGPQVADLNVWSLTNARERFWASRSRQLHQAHVSTFDRLWSCLPYLRPMLTIVADTIQYGRDADGAGCHDLLGTRCDPYVHKLLNGEELDVCCHSNLVRAVAPYHLTELDVHDVLNVFQVTGLTAEGRYFTKPSPARAGDFIEFFAELDVLAALSPSSGRAHPYARRLSAPRPADRAERVRRHCIQQMPAAGRARDLGLQHGHDRRGVRAALSRVDGRDHSDFDFQRFLLHAIHRHLPGSERPSVRGPHAEASLGGHS